MKLKKTAKAAIAEFVATTLFVYTGCGSVYSSGGDKLTIALAFGLSITSLAYTVGHVSGGHMNPIVTIAMLILGQLDILSGICYIVAQLLGAVTAAGFLTAGMKSHSVSSVVNQINDDNITVGGAFVMEVILSFLLVYVISETAINKKGGAGNCAPIAIGVAVFMAHIVAIPFTGCSINPARSFGPAVVAGKFNDLWMFFVAPIVGGSLAALISRYIFGVLEDTSCMTSNDEKVPYDRMETPETDAGTYIVTGTTSNADSNVEISASKTKSRDINFPIPMAPLDEEAGLRSPKESKAL